MLAPNTKIECPNCGKDYEYIRLKCPYCGDLNFNAIFDRVIFSAIYIFIIFGILVYLFRKFISHWFSRSWVFMVVLTYKCPRCGMIYPFWGRIKCLRCGYLNTYMTGQVVRGFIFFGLVLLGLVLWIFKLFSNHWITRLKCGSRKIGNPRWRRAIYNSCCFYILPCKPLEKG